MDVFRNGVKINGVGDVANRVRGLGIFSDIGNFSVWPVGGWEWWWWYG